MLLTDLVENWLNNDMIGETGMVENFDVSLCSSFIRKKRQQCCVKKNMCMFCPLFNVSILAVIKAWFFYLGFNLCV